MQASTHSESAAIQQALGGWYDAHRRDLPWRRTTDPYAIWVSEVMLQQTQVQTVEPYFHRFLQRFPDVQALARADEQAVLKLWEGLGYYSRARHLRSAARIIVDTSGGQLPSEWDQIRQLPGIGAYIAAALLSIAFDKPHAVVDGNVKRVLARLLCLETPVNHAAGHKIYQAEADRLLDCRNPGRHNQAMMELGALICTSQSPACGRCPLARFCTGLERGLVAHYPRRTERRALETRHWVAAAVLKNGRLLLIQRPGTGLLAGLWEFPGGPVEKPVDLPDACVRMIRQTTGLAVDAPTEVVTVRHTYTHFKLRLTLFLCRYKAGRIRATGAAHWLQPTELTRFPLHKAVHKSLPALMEQLAKKGDVVD